MGSGPRAGRPEGRASAAARTRRARPARGRADCGGWRRPASRPRPRASAARAPFASERRPEQREVAHGGGRGAAGASRARTLGSAAVAEATRDDAGKPSGCGAARGRRCTPAAEGRRAPPRGGQAPRPRARREALRPGLVRRARPLRAPPRIELRDDGAAPVRRRRRHRLRHGLRPQGLPLLPGLHRLRRLAERGLRREDLQGDGPRREVRLPRHRDQRLGRRADPGGRRLARGLRGDLLAQRPGVGRHPADLARDGPVRGRRRLLARDHRLRLHGRGLVVHVHHRPRRGEDRHRARR